MNINIHPTGVAAFDVVYLGFISLVLSACSALFFVWTADLLARVLILMRSKIVGGTR